MERDTGKYALYYSAILDACSYIKNEMQCGRWIRRRNYNSAKLETPTAPVQSAAGDTRPKGVKLAAQTLRVVIVGPGTGRLVQYCFDVAASVGIGCVAHLFEANATVVSVNAAATSIIRPRVTKELCIDWLLKNLCFN